MRALVTGGTGFIGSHLVDRLLANGISVDCLVRGAIKWLSPDSVGLTDTLPTDMHQYDIVYHVAGVLGQRGIPLSMYEDVHINMTSQIMARMNGTQLFVYVSTAWVEYPEKPYEQTKVIGEQHVRESSLNWRIVRPGFVYGPRDFHHLPMFQWIQKLGKYFPISGSGKNLVCPTYIDDVVRGLLACSKMKPVTTVAGAPITMQEFLFAIADTLGVAHPMLHIPPVIKGSFFAKERRFTTDIEPTELRVGLETTVQWYRERRLL